MGLQQLGFHMNVGAHHRSPTEKKNEKHSPRQGKLLKWVTKHHSAMSGPTPPPPRFWKGILLRWLNAWMPAKDSISGRTPNSSQGRQGFLVGKQGIQTIPEAPCMEYLPTFTINLSHGSYGNETHTLHQQIVLHLPRDDSMNQTRHIKKKVEVKPG